MRRKVAEAEAVLEALSSSLTKRARKKYVVEENAPPKRTKKEATPKVDEDKLESLYLPPADPEKPEFVDVRIEYYRRMAKAIWLKCSECSNGKAKLTEAGYAVPDCVYSACALYLYRDEMYKEKIRRGSSGSCAEESPRSGDRGQRQRKTRAGAAVRSAADHDDNGASGLGVSAGPGSEKDSGVSGAPEPRRPGALRKRASGGDSVLERGGTLSRRTRKTKGGS